MLLKNKWSFGLRPYKFDRLQQSLESAFFLAQAVLRYHEKPGNSPVNSNEKVAENATVFSGRPTCSTHGLIKMSTKQLKCPPYEAQKMV